MSCISVIIFPFLPINRFINERSAVDLCDAVPGRRHCNLHMTTPVQSLTRDLGLELLLPSHGPFHFHPVAHLNEVLRLQNISKHFFSYQKIS